MAPSLFLFVALAGLVAALGMAGLRQPTTTQRPASKRAQQRADRQAAHDRNVLPQAREALDDTAQFNVAGILGVVFALIGLIVTVALVDGLDNEYYNQTDNITTSMAGANFTNDTLNALTDPLSLLVGIVLLLGIVLLILANVGIV